METYWLYDQRGRVMQTLTMPEGSAVKEIKQQALRDLEDDHERRQAKVCVTARRSIIEAEVRYG